MQGTMVERTPGRWLIRVFAGRGSDGRTRHVNRTVLGTKRDAQRALARLIADVSGGQVVAGFRLLRGMVRSLRDGNDGT